MKQKLLFAALCIVGAPHLCAQNTTDAEKQQKQDVNAFTFTESQLGEDDDMTQNVIMVNSNNNVYTNNVGYLFSPMRFKFRAYNSRYNDTYVNGVSVSNAETGWFNYSSIGGLNEVTRNVESASPFESNNFSMSNLGGSNNYNFRAGSYAGGSKITLSAANRNYTTRAIFTHSTGMMNNGWAFTASLAYRWAKRGYIEGTFYNSLGYFFGVEKRINDKHSLSLSTWGSPTERSTQGAATDECYWLANSNYYNPYWGYQNGKKRNSRVVHNFEPSGVLTWDFNINKDTKLTTSFSTRYVKYSSTKLNYNNAENPAPDYWKSMPSSYYNVWDTESASRTDQNLADWQNSYNYWTASKANRQIDWDKLYFANQQVNKQGGDAAYYVQAKHNDHLAMNLSSTLKMNLDRYSYVNFGLNLGSNKGMHYQTMEDLLGATTYHNINTYAVGTYPATADQVQYDLRNRDKVVREGDRFGYDYNLNVQNAKFWAQYVLNRGRFHTYVSGKVSGTQMWRDGKMENGLAVGNSYGKSGKAHFLDGGGKAGTNINLGRGNVITAGIGAEARAPMTNTAFVAPEINNNFVSNLKCENVLSAELGYRLNTSWLTANVTGYYTHIDHQTEWQNFYFDDINSFSYVSLTGIKKAYYGVEWGLKFKVTSNFSLNAIGTVSEAKYLNNARVSYMNSTSAKTTTEYCMSKDMRESGSPLTAINFGASYHAGGWYIDLNENYYDRIYLSYSTCLRYQSTLTTMGKVDNSGNYIVPGQAKGKGGWTTDLSIGKSIYLKRGSLNINLMVNNLLNNTKLCSGGYEQSRSNYSTNAVAGTTSLRTYDFQRNPKKYYVQGTNFMLNVGYKF
jgi:hypothetical protein